MPQFVMDLPHCYRYVIALVCFVVCNAHSQAVADDDPREIVRRALKEMGGKDQLEHLHCIHSEHRGWLNLGGNDVRLTMTTWQEGRERVNTRFVLQGMINLNMHIVVNGTKGWQVENGQVRLMSAEEMAEMRSSAGPTSLPLLAKLLEAEKTEWQYLGEREIDKQAVLSVKAIRKNEPDVEIQFAKTTGLPVKLSMLGDPNSKINAHRKTQHSYFSDYRVLDTMHQAKEFLERSKQKLDTPDLLQLLQQRIPNDKQRQLVGALIEQLGADSFRVRTAAGKKLADLGKVAEPFLRQAMQSDDAEVVQRAKDCLDQIGTNDQEELLVNAIRLLALRKEASAFPLLLQYAPFGESAKIKSEVKAALLHMLAVDQRFVATLKTKTNGSDDQAALATQILNMHQGIIPKETSLPVYVRQLRIPFRMQIQSADENASTRFELLSIEFFNGLPDTKFQQPTS